MNDVFTREYQSELHDVDEIFKNGLMPWWDDVCDYLCRLEKDYTWENLPGLVLCIYRYLGLNTKISILMADIFKTVYFANTIHTFIADDEEGQEHNQELQFNILIGDYAFGRILKLLVEAKAVKMLKDFSDMMSEINEGLVLKHKLNAGQHQTIRKTKAPLYATAFFTAAKLSGVDEASHDLYRHMGYNLGMAIELMGNPRLRAEAQVYVHKSEEIFEEINKRNNILNSTLERVIKGLHDILCTKDEIAVV